MTTATSTAPSTALAPATIPAVNQRAAPRWRAIALSALMLASATAAQAGPGAHGPNGEHLDAPTAGHAATAHPRVEARSDDFELVATLQPGELSIFIDRYTSNEPVLKAALELESGGIRSKAAFRADQGDYVVVEPRLLALLRTPGQHALVFTLATGADNDLLDATLVTSAGEARAANGEHGHAHADDGPGQAHTLGRAAWTGAGLATLGLIGGMAWWRQQRRNATQLPGGL